MLKNIFEEKKFQKNNFWGFAWGKNGENLGIFTDF